MTKKKKQREYDENIVEALLNLKTPIIGKSGKLFFIRDEARYESGIYHIANKGHRLKVRDIESIASILKHPFFETTDPNNKNYRNYYGVRKGLNKNDILLKIVTWPYETKSGVELIITLYPTNAIKIEKDSK